MKTDELIDMLSKSAAHESAATDIAHRKWALGLGLLVAILGCIALYRLNPNLMALLNKPWFWLRFVFLASLGAAAWAIMNRASIPGQERQLPWHWLVLPIVVMALFAVYLLWQAEPQARLTMLLGSTWKVCSSLISFLAIPIFISAVYFVKAFAPTRLKISGGILGLFSGASAALIYTLHCPELHPVFLVVWYGLGIAIPGVLGWFLGERLLRW